MKMRTRLVLITGALTLAALAATGGLLLTASSAEASPDYTGFHAFIDAGQGTYFSFTLDSMSKPAGMASFGIKGVGMVDIASPKIDIHDGHSISISSNGSATLETDAVIDLNLGLNRPGQNLQTVSVRLQGEIDPGADHATVQLWLADKHYLVVGDRPDASPDQALRKVVDAVNHQNWGALYDMGTPTLQQMASRSDFSSGMTTGWQSHLGTGKVDVRLTSEPKLIDSTFGYWTAQADLRVSSGATSFTFKVILEYVSKRWLLLTIAPAS
jgi:hypothetical protein